MCPWATRRRAGPQVAWSAPSRTDGSMEQEELLTLFVRDAGEMLRDLEEQLVLLEERPDDQELVRHIFRAAHTLKGNAGLVGLQPLVEILHQTETVLDAVRKERLAPEPELVSTLLAAVDVVHAMLAAAPAIDAASIPGYEASVTRLRRAVSGGGSSPAPRSGNPPGATPQQQAPPATTARAERFRVELGFDPCVLEDGHDPSVLVEELASLGTLLRTEVDLASLPSFDDLDPSQAYLRWTLELETAGGRQAIEDLLAFVPDRSAVSVQTLPPSGSSPARPLASPAPTPVTVPVAPASLPAGAASGVSVSAATSPPAAARSRPSTSWGDVPTPVPASAPSAGPADLRAAEREPEEAAAAPAWSGPVEPEAAPPSPASTGPDRSGLLDREVRVNVRVLDLLMVLAGEMVLVRNQLQQATLEEDARLIERATQRVDLITGELQDAVMATRMVSIRAVFHKFKRLVRDMAHDLGRRVRLELQGEDVELDRTLIESLGDPLTHLVRNAIDHGMESPEQRRAAGKPVVGTVRLSAAHKAGQVVIEVSDDGRGIDPERVAAKAMAAGIVTPAELAGMSPKGVLGLLFRPGFSMASRLTQFSGRGVGLDVVMSALSSLGSTVDLDSQPGRGCTVSIKLPLTLAILPSLLVQLEGQRFAIPQLNVLELHRVRAQDRSRRIERIGSLDVIRLRGQLLPVVHLREVLGLSEATWSPGPGDERLPDQRLALADRREPEPDTGGSELERRAGTDRRHSAASALKVAIVAAGDLHYGLVVDEFLDCAEIVVKPLGRHLSTCKIYAGATVLGDGRAALILDVAGISRTLGLSTRPELAVVRRRSKRAEEAAGEERTLLVLEGAPGERFALELAAVQRIVRAEQGQVRTIAGRRTLRYGAGAVPLFTLDDVASVAPLPPTPRPHVVMFDYAGREMGLMSVGIVDTVTTTATVDRLTHRQPGVSGSLVIDDHIVLLVDVDEVVATAVPAWAALPSERPASQDGGQRILVVDDSTFFRSQIALMFEEAGYTVETADDGAAALALLKEDPTRCDLVCTDIEMPELDGFELVERMRAVPELVRIPVVAVTTLMGAEYLERSRSVGIDVYAIKLDRSLVLQHCKDLLSTGRPG